MLELINKSANKLNKGAEKYVSFMTHINHHHEITKDLAIAVKKIRHHDFTIRNQTVFLNHMNDYYRTLAETFRSMFWIGIHPYYLLQCHKERGIVHFIAPIQICKIYHDTLNEESRIDDKISESYATVSTQDGKELYRYEALGRASCEEFDHAVKIMDAFIGRKGVFLPKVIIIDGEGKHVETTNRTKLPDINQLKKSQLLGYNLNTNNMPLTNPADIANELDKQFNKSKYHRIKS